MTSPGYRRVDQVWSIDQQGEVDFDGTITLVATQFWEVLTPREGNFVQFGFVVRSNVNSFNPSKATVNGLACAIDGVKLGAVNTQSFLPINLAVVSTAP